jgi:hypothetical protein
VKFILGGSGHIAGIVNPPASNKYQYWTTDKLAASADEWLAGAQRNPGSWWPAWNEWVSRFAGEKVPARKPGEGKLKIIEDAPGSYAKLRLDQTSQAPSPAPMQTHAPAIDEISSTILNAKTLHTEVASNDPQQPEPVSPQTAKTSRPRKRKS